MRFLVTILITLSVTTAYANAQALPGTKRDFKFERKLARLNLEDGAKYDFYVKTGGTSIGFKVAKKGKRKSGVFIPTNESTHPEGEVVTYRLARLLRVSDLFNPVDYYTLGPKAIDRFRHMLRAERNFLRRTNTNRIRRLINRNDQRLFGIYKYRPKRRSQAVEHLNRRNRLNKRQNLTTFIKANGPRPGTRQIGLKRVRRDKKTFEHPRESERELARQLSIILVMDMLTGQWDRFSGGNIEALAHKDGRLQFIARDNGGATFGKNWTWFKRYSRWVTRYDAAFIDRLQRLNNFLQGRTPDYGKFKNLSSFVDAIGFLKERSFNNFRAKLRRFVDDEVKKLKTAYGKRIYFKDTKLVASADQSEQQN